MIISTTSTLQDRKVLTYHGVVNGNAIIGVNVFKDIMAGFRDIFGGRSASYEKELAKAKQIAIDEMQAEAKDMGANAIIGVDLDFETVGEGGGMLMVNASGTAVSIEE